MHVLCLVIWTDCLGNTTVSAPAALFRDNSVSWEQWRHLAPDGTVQLDPPLNGARQRLSIRFPSHQHSEALVMQEGKWWVWGYTGTGKCTVMIASEVVDGFALRKYMLHGLHFVNAVALMHDRPYYCTMHFNSQHDCNLVLHKTYDCE